MTSLLPKFATEQGDLWDKHCYGAFYAQQETRGHDRLIVGASENGSDLLSEFASLYTPPFYILYVLVVPRGGSAPGRYQSLELGRKELEVMLTKFGEFWDADGRHAVWLRSITDETTLVYSRDNLIYLYGDRARFVVMLNSRGYSEVPTLEPPAPHQHAYLKEYDSAEVECTAAIHGNHTDLRPEDER